MTFNHHSAHAVLVDGTTGSTRLLKHRGGMFVDITHYYTSLEAVACYYSHTVLIEVVDKYTEYSLFAEVTLKIAHWFKLSLAGPGPAIYSCRAFMAAPNSARLAGYWR